MFFVKQYKLDVLLVFLVALTFFSWLQSASILPDPDGFYHAKIAQLIGQQGVVQDFPYLQSTTLKHDFIDHHFLYHLILIPFVKIFTPLIGVKIAQSILVGLLIAIFYKFLKKEKVKLPLLWILILITSSPFVFRISLIKANSLSLIFLFIGLGFIFCQKYWHLLALSYFYVWAYGGWPLLLIFVLFFTAANQLLEKIKPKTAWQYILRKINFLKQGQQKRLPNLKLFLSCSIGLILGLMINPYFPKNLKFYLLSPPIPLT